MVLLGNNRPCKIQGIGSVRIKMYDGVERLLTQVRYIPELKRNLISLGVLDELGYSIKMECGSLKILKGSLVMLKGVKKNGIYSLLGSTVVGNVSTASGLDWKVAMLFNKRLGHMSERGLTELVKQGFLGNVNLQGMEFCETCVYGKSCRVKFSTGVQRTKGTLDYVHSDL